MLGKTTPLVLTLIAVLFATPQQGWSEALIGKNAPAFTLSDTGGNTHSLSDYAKKYVVLEWFNHGCPFVKKHYKKGDMQKLQKEYRDKGVAWFSICSSGPGKQGYHEPDAAQSIATEKGANPSAVLLDPSGKVGKLYNAKVTPHIFIINPSGKLIYQGAIDDIPSTNPGDIETANNYVRSTLDAAMANQPLAVTSTKPYGCSVKYAD